jgi:hypothetical protein
VVVLAYLLIAFKVWMLLDVIRRRIHVLWYLVVLAPLGDVVYFFVVKLRDFQPHPAATPAVPNPRERTLATLERAVAETPSFDNRVRFGWALLEAGQAERAVGFFQLAAQSHRNDKEAPFGLGLAYLESGDNESAVTSLLPLVERHLEYEQFAAALALAEALYRAGHKADTIELLRAISSRSRRLEHRLVLARYQLRGDHKADARDTLQAALGEFDGQPDPVVRMSNGAAATEARRLLRTLEHQLGQTQLPSRG